MDGVELGKELWSCFKCPISTPSHGLAEEVKVGSVVRMITRVLLGPESKTFHAERRVGGI